MYIIAQLSKWYRCFRKRHHDLISERDTETTTQRRVNAEYKQELIDAYFHHLAKYRTLPHHRIFAGDETGLDGDGDRVKTVVSPKGAKRVRTAEDSYREHISILHIGNAAGDSLAPIIIQKGESLDMSMAQQVFNWNPDILFGCQKNGYFIAEHFKQVLQYLCKHVQPQPSKDCPILFIIDGAKAHCSLDALQYAVDHGIHLLCLPPHTSHFLQVADLSVFGPFKKAWHQACAEHKLNYLEAHHHQHGVELSVVISFH